MIDERNIEPIQPDHRALSLLTVVVPAPRGRHDEVARIHIRFFAVDRGIGPRPLDNETQCRLCVPVRRCDLAASDQLQRAEESMRCAARKARVVQDQNSALGFFRRLEALVTRCTGVEPRRDDAAFAAKPTR